MKDNEMEALKEDLHNLRLGFYEGEAAEHFFLKICKAVESGEITWDELGTNLQQAKEWLRICKVNSLKADLHRMSREIFSFTVASFCVQCVKSAIEKGITTWEELKTTPEELEKLLKKAKK